MYICKRKIQAIIDSQRTTNTVESERIGLNLDDVANIVKNFKDPPLPEDKYEVTEIELTVIPQKAEAPYGIKNSLKDVEESYDFGKFFRFKIQLSLSQEFHFV